MMNAIGNVSSYAGQFYTQGAATGSQSGSGVDADGDNDGSTGAGRIGRSGGFAQTIMQALQQSLGGATTQQPATDGSAPNSTTATPDISSALQGFMQNLFAVLHQSGGQAQTGSGGTNADGSNDGGQAASVRHHGHGRGHGGLANRIQGLLQQLSSNGQASSSDTQAGSSDALAALNSSFQDLLKAAGGSSSGLTLQSFLQNLQQDLGSGPVATGSVVSTQA